MSRAAKKPVNLSLDAELVARAQKLDINLSAVAEEALRAAIRNETAALWRADNAAAIEDYNRMVARDGVLSERARVG